MRQSSCTNSADVVAAVVELRVDRRRGSGSRSTSCRPDSRAAATRPSCPTRRRRASGLRLREGAIEGEAAGRRGRVLLIVDQRAELAAELERVVAGGLAQHLGPRPRVADREDAAVVAAERAAERRVAVPLDLRERLALDLRREARGEAELRRIEVVAVGGDVEVVADEADARAQDQRRAEHRRVLDGEARRSCGRADTRARLPAGTPRSR